MSKVPKGQKSKGFRDMVVLLMECETYWNIFLSVFFILGGTSLIMASGVILFERLSMYAIYDSVYLFMFFYAVVLAFLGVIMIGYARSIVENSW